MCLKCVCVVGMQSDTQKYKQNLFYFILNAVGVIENFGGGKRHELIVLEREIWR